MPTIQGAELAPLQKISYLVEPWAHQRTAIDLASPADVNEFALFFEMGTGKTMTMINILRHKYLEHRRVLRTLIVAPLIVLENWKKEWAMHAKIPPDRIVVLKGTGTQRKRQFENGVKAGVNIFILNYETLTYMPQMHQLLLAWQPEVLVLDESHRCKDLKAKRTKRAFELAKSTLYRYLLSGSPVLASPMDLFSQFKILDRGATFGTNFHVFKYNYFYDKNAGMPSHVYFPDWRIKPGALDEINQKIKTKGMRITKAECLDLPDLVRETVYVELAEQQQRLYDSMKKDFLAVLGDKTVTATIALTKALRLLQITTGFVVAEGEAGSEVVSLKENPRASALKELLTELTPHSKVIVWAVFKENYATIRKVLDELGVGYVVVTGDVPTPEKHAAVDRFQNDQACRVYLGHPGAGGIGVNLTAASYSIWYSRTFSLEHDLQAESRNHRGGSEIHARITRIDLVAKDTIDELVLEKLASKQAIGEQLLKDMARAG